MTADDIIALLGLQPHPEGGYFRETFRDAPGADGRAASTAIYFLLKRGERSHWHTVDAVEIWHWHAGAPLKLSLAATDAGPVTEVILGADLAKGERPARRRAAASLAGRRDPRRLDAGRLHGRARLRLRRLPPRRPRLAAGRLTHCTTD